MRAARGALRIINGDLAKIVGREPVGRPFPHVAMHVKKSPGVRLVGAYGRGLLRRTAGGAAKPGLVWLEFVAGIKRRRRAGPAGVFPFGFGRKPILPSRCPFLWELREEFAKETGVLPSQMFNRQVITSFVALRVNEFLASAF